MNKKTIISASDDIVLKFKVLAKEKEGVRLKLAVTAGKLRLKAKQLVVTAKEKEGVRLKLAVTAGKLRLKAKQLVVTAKEKESIRLKLAVSAGKLGIKAKQLAKTAKEKESIRLKLAVTAKKLALIAKEKESVRRKLAVTAEKLIVVAEKLAVTAKEKESIRLKLAVTAEALRGSREILEIKVLERTKDLANVKARDEAILESIGDGLVVVDKEGKILRVNNAFENLFGWQGKEVLGRLLVEVVPREDEAGNVVPFKERILNKILTTTTTTTAVADWYYVRKDKTRFPAASIITPFILEGKVIGAVEVFRDITKEKEIDKAKTEFVSLASHQLRTPLTTISWCVEMLLKGDIGKILPDQEKYLERIYQGNQRMIELVSALLNVSRIELETFIAEPTQTDIIVLARSVLDEQKPEIEKKKLIIIENFSKDVPIFSFDPKFLRMVFQNLLINAVEYTPLGGRIEFTISMDKKKTVLVKVTDTGYGIPKNQQHQIFTKFFRADNVKKKDTDGTGLGLYIVKSIVENFGGKIWFESPASAEGYGAARENPGTTFYVTLPLNV